MMGGCSGQKKAEQSFEELFKSKQERVANYLKEEDFELAGLKATREMHNSGGKITGTIEFRANARDGSVLSAVYHFSWKGGQWGLTSSQPARLTRKGSSKELKKIDRIMESSDY